MKEDGGEEVEEGGEGRGERGRVAKVTKDPQVRTLQQLVRAETEKSQATPAQKSQVTPDRSHKRPLYPLNMLCSQGVKCLDVRHINIVVQSGHFLRKGSCHKYVLLAVSRLMPGDGDQECGTRTQIFQYLYMYILYSICMISYVFVHMYI